jgi:four helix bundle protein
MGGHFGHEKLDVYREAIAFVVWWTEIRPRCSGGANVQDQLDRASTGMPLNIAEGNGRFSPRDRSHFFRIASGSALECAACLDVLVAGNRLASQDVGPGKDRLRRIVSMLIGLISKSSDRVAEGRVDYSLGITPSDGAWDDQTSE